MTLTNFKDEEYLGKDHKLGKYGFKFYSASEISDLEKAEYLVMRAEVDSKQ